MLPLLVAAAEAIPAIGKIVDAISHHEDKAQTAAQVAADPKAPQNVKDAAKEVASKAIDDKAHAEKAGLGVIAGDAPSSKGAATTSNIAVFIVLGAALLLGRRR